MQYVPELGKIIEGEARRDAIHVAVAPVVAGGDLSPGQHVSLCETTDMGLVAGNFGGVATIGVVDPFLSGLVKKGQLFWLCLYPNTVTSLRHVWTHPAFTTKASQPSEIPLVPRKVAQEIADG